MKFHRLQQMLEMISIVQHAFQARPPEKFTLNNSHVVGCSPCTTVALNGFSFRGSLASHAYGLETRAFCARCRGSLRYAFKPNADYTQFVFSDTQFHFRFHGQ